MSSPHRAPYLLAMPTALRIGAYRFFFYAGDRAERVHIHVRRDEREARFWLEPVRLEWNRGFTLRELNVLEGLVQEHAESLVRAWCEYFEAGD